MTKSNSNISAICLGRLVKAVLLHLVLLPLVSPTPIRIETPSQVLTPPKRTVEDDDDDGYSLHFTQSSGGSVPSPGPASLTAIPAGIITGSASPAETVLPSPEEALNLVHRPRRILGISQQTTGYDRFSPVEKLNRIETSNKRVERSAGGLSPLDKINLVDTDGGDGRFPTSKLTTVSGYHRVQARKPPLLSLTSRLLAPPPREEEESQIEYGFVGEE